MKRVYVAAGVLALAMIAGVAVLRTPALQSARAQSSLASDLGKLGRDIGDVALVDEAGRRVRWRSMEGRPRAVFFGFTHCPVVCPVTVWELNNAVEQIGPSANALQIQFVTLDPERDTPQAMAKYFGGFEGRVDAYSGAPADIARIARSFDVTHRRTDLGGGDYTIDHTATVFLLDARGTVVDVVAYGAPPEVLESRLRALLSGSPRA